MGKIMIRRSIDLEKMESRRWSIEDEADSAKVKEEELK
jgi:hypothetical protein